MTKRAPTEVAMLQDHRDEWIERIVPGKSFVDVGGLWGLVNEKISPGPQRGGDRSLHGGYLGAKQRVVGEVSGALLRKENRPGPGGRVEHRQSQYINQRRAVRHCPLQWRFISLPKPVFDDQEFKIPREGNDIVGYSCDASGR